MNTEHFSKSKKNLYPWLLFFTFIALAAIPLWRTYEPTSIYVPYSSDDAIPVIMVNDVSPLGWFHLYFFGMDRYGAWPFLLLNMFHRLFGVIWQIQAIFNFALLYFLSGIFAVAILAGSQITGMIAAAACLVVWALDLCAGHEIYEICTPFAWIIPSLLWFWVIFQYFCQSVGKPHERRALFFTFLAAFVTLWTSLSALPMVLAIILLEGWTYGLRPRQWAKALGPFFFALLIERLCNQRYNIFVGRNFDRSYRSHTNIDWQNIGNNFLGLMTTISQSPWLFVYLAGIFAGILALWLLWLMRKSTDCKNLYKLSAGLFLMGLGNFVLCALVSHVRLNLYHIRYLSPSMAFWSASAVVLAVSFLKFPRKSPLFVLGGSMFCAGAVIFFGLPPQQENKFFRVVHDVGRRAAERFSGAVIGGPYWGVYIFEGAYPQGNFTSAALSGESDRVPWNKHALMKSDKVLMTFYRGDSDHESVPTPAKYIFTHQTLFGLTEPNAVPGQAFSLSLYDNISLQNAGLKKLPEMLLCATESSNLVDIPADPMKTLLLYLPDHKAERFAEQYVAQLEGGAKNSPLEFMRSEDFVVVSLPSGDLRGKKINLLPKQNSPVKDRVCNIDHLFWLP